MRSTRLGSLPALVRQFNHHKLFLRNTRRTILLPLSWEEGLRASRDDSGKPLSSCRGEPVESKSDSIWIWRRCLLMKHLLLRRSRNDCRYLSRMTALLERMTCTTASAWRRERRRRFGFIYDGFSSRGVVGSAA